MPVKKLTALAAAVMLGLAALPAGAELVTLPIDLSGGLPYEAVFDRNVRSYEDPSIRVSWDMIPAADVPYNCTIFYAKVTIADASQLRTVSVNGFDQHNRARAIVMARRVNAVLAVNGDYYGARPNCYVLRQGVVYRDDITDEQDVLLIDEDGDLHVILADEDARAADKEHWEGKRIINGFTFGPALIVNDEVVLNEAHAPAMSTPEGRAWRTCLVQTGHLEYMIICTRDVGATALEMIDIVHDLTDHVDVAYLLDGGQSSQLVFLGETVNQTNRESR